MVAFCFDFDPDPPERPSAAGEAGVSVTPTWFRGVDSEDRTSALRGVAASNEPPVPAPADSGRLKDAVLGRVIPRNGCDSGSSDGLDCKDSEDT